ncbi:SAVED domain-containing protein [Sunxiuqinia elliptica]|uniref:SMODS-associated and fused to various effectors domain-containing protein n=1 Tax=Sunxiuqinia elliptica TaxID=655355 RepID=A0A4R6HC94_9BACT|nr:SAVED domain-containing protein [Sunxiuqinia elliptica]TDO05396.1 hypothetical protein DET52_101756 [Sunxiuqinia elliptica]TDO64943.1 hypothetical protein DET65_1315 [Sunxiuqinia elliptica]
MANKTTKRRPSIPVDVKTQLWTFSAGRCQFDNCNKPLWRHDVTMDKMNKAYIAHIYAYSPEGPRYDPVLSPKLETDFSNLMLVCDECHRLFDDKSKVEEYAAERLIQMKKEHEERIKLLTDINPEKKSHIILFGAKIGQHASPLSYQNTRHAIIPEYYPVASNAVELGIKNISLEDAGDNYWQLQEENLSISFADQLKHLKENSPVQHYSVFGLAPQPLLIKLGTLLNDIYPAEVYQLHREPSTWKWLEEDKEIKYELLDPPKKGKHVTLKFELSATITDDRITNVLGEDTAVWSIKIEVPDNDYLRSKNQLQNFRKIARNAFNQIKAIHGQQTTLHIFPAMPVATAIELGRVWMPKADMPMVIYDQNSQRNGFIKTLEIKPN